MSSKQGSTIHKPTHAPHRHRSSRTATPHRDQAPPSGKIRVFLAVTMTAAGLMLGGCQCRDCSEPVAADPTVDDSHIRHWPRAELAVPSRSVEHGPVYLAGLFETDGDQDGRFRWWTITDSLGLISEPLMVPVNIMALPVKMALAPPWQDQSGLGGFERLAPTGNLPGQPSQATANEPVACELSNTVTINSEHE